jgi:hypothetical protein
MMEIVEQVKQRLGEPYGVVCRELDLPYSSVMRWRSRWKAGEALVGTPGPGKTESLNVAGLNADILELRHGRERTRGTGALLEKYRDQISRRACLALVEAARRELMREEGALERRIEWRVPGLVWSMDDTEVQLLVMGKGRIHLLQDLGSRYKLRVLGDEVMARGERVAENLAELFARRGPPLFLKRDNGSNLNHHAVNEVLDEFGVIPLNSPPHYPPYNGGIERAQMEMQWALEARIGAERVDPRVFRLECEVSGHEVNHRRRRSLGWRTSCHALEDGRPLVKLFGRRERKEVYEEIKELAVDIAEQLDQHTEAAAETAFRYAAETWMQGNGLIRVSQNGEVLPCFYQIQTH